MKLEFRKLKASEIEVRIGTCKANGVSLLLYKDARVDMRLLDEVVGATNWQRFHTRDNANCTVSIWDDEKNQWISKEDTGVDSNTEAEKGRASDSFKRACFNWGIGRELYTAPFIWFNSNDCNISNGKCYDRFECQDIAYNEEGEIAMVDILNTKTGKRFIYGKTDAQGKKKVEELQKKNDEKQKEMQERMDILMCLEQLGFDEKFLTSAYKVKSIDDVSTAKLKQALEKKRKEKEEVQEDLIQTEETKQSYRMME